MRKQVLCMCLCAVLLCGCSQNGEETETVKASLTSADVVETMFYGSVAAVEDGIAYLAGQDGGELVSLPLQGLAIRNEDGDHMEAEALSGGMEVRVSYDGTIAECYPAKLSQPKTITVLERECDVVGLYRQAIRDIYEDDPGLNEGDTYAAFDLTEAGNLSEGEKDALIYLAGQDLNRETLSGTMETLTQEGYIDGEDLFFPKGVLITITDEEPKINGKFSFDIQKWKSGKGAILYQDCKAVWEEDAYSYEIGTMGVS